MGSKRRGAGPEPGSPEHWPWVAERIREYAQREGIDVRQARRDPFLADQARRYGSGAVTRNDVGTWSETVGKIDASATFHALFEQVAAGAAQYEVDISDLDFDDDTTAPNYNKSLGSCAPETPRQPEPRELLEAQKARAEAAVLKRQLKATIEELRQADERAGIVDALRGAKEPPPITRREFASGMREATAVVMVSDLHLEEVVDPRAIEYRNAFNLDIARLRMGRLADGFLWFLGLNRSRFAIRDAIMWLGGDIITNYLHEELEETNALTPIEAVIFAHEQVGGLIQSVLDRGDLERLVVPCNVGNHGRTTMYTRSKTRVENSYEYLLYHQLQQTFASDPRVEFRIATGSHLYVQVYDQTWRFTHGDDIKYGGGIGGITIPIRKALASWDSFRPADLSLMGHWHQLLHGRNFVVNSSLIGYSEYSLQIKADFEPPAQAFFLADSKYGRTCASPIFVEDENEGWRIAA